MRSKREAKEEEDYNDPKERRRRHDRKKGANRAQRNAEKRDKQCVADEEELAHLVEHRKYEQFITVYETAKEKCRHDQTPTTLR